MKAILTSSSFSNDNIFDSLFSIVKEKNYKNSAIITTAHPQKELANNNIKTSIDLKNMGLNTRFVDFEKNENISDEEVVYVGGGNTYKLLYFARKMNFKYSLDLLFERGGIYFGSSAGSIILSPTILSVVVDNTSSRDRNIIGLTDFAGLNFINFNIIVHFVDTYESIVKSLQDIDNREIIRLKDGTSCIYRWSGEENY